MKYPTTLVSICLYFFFSPYCFGQSVDIDLTREFTIDIYGLKDEFGASIQLAPKNGSPFLRFHSFDMPNDLGFPHIYRSAEFPLVFGIHDGSFKEQFRLDPVGDVLIQSLQGLNRRNLLVNEEGKIFADTVTGGYAGVVNISNFEFVSIENPEDHNWHYDRAGKSGTYHEGLLIAAIDEGLVAPIHLPHGATVKKIIIYYFDNDGSSNNVSFSWNSLKHVGGFSIFLLGVTSAASPDIRTIEKTAIPDSTLFHIDNINRHYEITALPTINNQWPSENITINQVVIFYDL